MTPPRRTCFGIMLAALCGAAAAAGAQPAAPADPQGKIVSTQGRVEHAEARRDAWTTARVFQPLFVEERVRTVAASRAAVLFVDETQVKLNAGAVLTVHRVRTRGAVASAAFELVSGEGWFRTKNAAGGGLTVTTPAATAAIRGTEITVALRPNNETVLTVVEGSAEFSNAQGSILVVAGEEATASPGQPPTKRTLLNPEDAVQWVMYYPAVPALHDLPAVATAGPSAAGFDQLRAGRAAAALQLFAAATGDVWSRIGASMAQVALGDAAAARASLEAPELIAATDRETVVVRRSQMAAVALASGDAVAARRELDAALALDPSGARPLALLSAIELQQNHADRARQAARTAVEAHADSVAAQIAAAEAAQAAFDLAAAERHLNAALALDGRDLRARVDRARLRFGRVDSAGARADATAAAAVAPDDAQVRSLGGFIQLADGNATEAAADFEAAIAADAELGEPHLGLGLLYFRDGRTNDGLIEMLTATLLEPKVSLYQSYLGKAYYQLQRFPEGLAALESAKRLDPRDPTPWLYTSLFLRDQNRQVEALDQLRRAIALNDNRAVYRSRLLLDRDLATKNVSLAEVYRQLGFEAWGAFEALRSLEADATNASAHLFMAETYGRLPDRTQALSGELLQYFLYAPVNRNSFNNFAEYTALLEQPRRQLLATGESGSQRHAYGDLSWRTGNERFAHASFVELRQRDGFRPSDRDNRYQAFAEGKLALGAASDLFFEVTAVGQTRGADEVEVATVTVNKQPVLVRQYAAAPSPYEVNDDRTFEGVVGFRRTWRPGSVLTAAVDVTNLELKNDVTAPLAICAFAALLGQNCPYGSIKRSTTPDRTRDFQVQQATQLGRHQFIVGASYFREQQDTRSYFATTIDGVPDFEFTDDTAALDHAATVFFRDEIQLVPRVHVTGAVQYQRLDYTERLSQEVMPFRGWKPMFGISLRVTPTTVVRGMALKNVNTSFVGARISPATIGGFPIERNELPATDRREYALAVEHSRGRAFAGAQAFARDVESLPFMTGAGANPEADAATRGGGAYVNVIVTRYVTLFGDDQYSMLDAKSYDRRDNVVRLGANMIHPSGLQLRATVSRVDQRFGRVDQALLPPSRFTVLDASIGYEFARKRGLASVDATNLFDKSFAAAVEGLSIQQWLPRRRVLASIRWRLW